MLGSLSTDPVLQGFWDQCLARVPAVFEYPLIQHVTMVIVFYSVAIPMALADLFGLSKPLQYKVKQHGPPVTWSNLMQCVKVSARTQLVVLFFLSLLHFGLGLVKTLPKEAPTLVESCGVLALLFLMFDIGFYAVHRLMHVSKWLYQNVHKHHHEFSFPFSLVAFYMHPLEMILSSLCITLPVALVQPHPLLGFLFTLGISLEGCFGHAGYEKFGSPRHYVHHLTRNYNYAVFFPWIDMLFGTFLKPELITQSTVPRTEKPQMQTQDKGRSQTVES